METLSTFHIKILQILAVRYGMSCTLEELTSLLTPAIDITIAFSDYISIEKEKQATVLNALIVLDNEGLIFLNSSTDKSIITIKGMIKIDNTLFCN
ncbi:hypothetical protein ASF10_22855 [Flavobacterium sp. Leaf82]|jgi:hypothetical protein|uniref:hypothetical protein n=1 Tax=unclassified Flavobacterium TaxID=196869 RepID=UPI0006F7F69C|nr:hypothetical protein [Flavobacterium sp. Leaf82]KQO28666.1 hypothetical protein ASF10_22855 [Flavobacterium sp. Leaf82]